MRYVTDTGMQWQSEQREGGLIFAPGERVDHENADEFQAVLLQVLAAASDAGSRLVIDMNDVPYMSSVGLRALLRAGVEARKGATEIMIVNLNATMREIFEISRFHRIFEIRDDVGAALR